MKFISANVNAGLRTVPGTQQTLYVFVVGILVIIITITYFNVVLSLRTLSEGNILRVIL